MLGTNFRSRRRCSNSVNSLFGGKHANSFIYNECHSRFNAVAAKGKKADESFLIDGQPATAFEICVLFSDTAGR